MVIFILISKLYPKGIIIIIIIIEERYVVMSLLTFIECQIGD